MAELPNYDKMLSEARLIAQNSNSPFTLRMHLQRTIDAVDTLLAERAVRAAISAPREVATNPTLDVLHEISGKLDTIIDHQKYG